MSLPQRLRDQLQDADRVLPTVGVDLAWTVRRGRLLRRRRASVAGAAATAAVAVSVLIAAPLAPRTELGPASEPTAEPGDTATPSRPATPSEPTPGGPTPSEAPATTQAPSLDQVEPVLRRWLGAIQQGDIEEAWTLLTPEARAVVGRERFEQLMASGLREGMAAFADAPSFHHVVVSAGGPETRVVAVASGVLTREGATEFAAAAIPMRVREGETLVDEHFDPSPYRERVAVFASASAGPFSFRKGDDLIVEFSQPDGATAVLVSVDDDRQPLPTEFDPATGQAAATLDRDLRAGRHIATVVVLHESGRLYAEAVLFEAAAP